MRREIMQCDTCTKQHDLRDGPLLPAGWVTLIQRSHYDMHFCSYICHADWARKHFGMAEQAQQPVEQPQSKMRRFLLFDENAEEYEGVQWGDGRVNVPDKRTFLSWDDFKRAHPDCGIQWIDQEVSNA